MPGPIYLDHAATTPLDPRVLEAMRPYLTEHYGNASSVHALGRRARFAVEESRERIAALLGAEPGEIVFTSGGTEANNTAIRGMTAGGRPGLVTTAAEHEAVLRPAEALAAAGHPVTILPPDSTGAVCAACVSAALTPGTGLVSVMHANNEIGTLNPVAEIAAVCRRHGVPVHCDAVQTAGLFRLRVDDLGVDLLSASAHKFYGPKGIGLLYVRGGVDLQPLVLGGAQERRRRGGTENVAAIVGMATALELAYAEADARVAHLAALQRRLHDGLRQALDVPFVLNTPLEDGKAAPHLLNIAFPPVDGRAIDGEMLLLNLDLAGVLVSAGSACTSGALEPSHVLLAIGRDPATAAAAVRFSAGKDTSEADVDAAVDHLQRIVRRMVR
ncbi:cysteine desulfurase NifS [Rhodothermaceae bacterium RA]|nr:cysteine desulfurase NifS [Rhodothermaceae bacterium RA]